MRSRDLELTEPMLLNGSPWGRHRVDSGGFQTNFFQAEMKELRARMPFLTEADAFLEKSRDAFRSPLFDPLGGKCFFGRKSCSIQHIVDRIHSNINIIVIIDALAKNTMFYPYTFNIPVLLCMAE